MNQGFIEPVKLKLKHNFVFEDDLKFLTALLKIQNQEEYILFDVRDGKILGISKAIFTLIF